MSSWVIWKNKFGIENALTYSPKGDGNCLLSSIAEGLQPVLMTNVNQLRYWAAQQLLMESDEWAQLAITSYREECNRGQFDGKWSPHECNSKEELAAAITAPLYTGDAMAFQGDAFILVLLSKALKIDFVVFEHQKSFGYTRIDNHEKKNQQTIFLLYQNEVHPKTKFSYKHYQVLGIECVDNNIQSIFDSNFLPDNFAKYLHDEENRNKENELLKKKD
jgi:hypothetical protein